MVQAPVGFQCPECVHQAQPAARTAPTWGTGGSGPDAGRAAPPPGAFGRSRTGGLAGGRRPEAVVPGGHWWDGKPLVTLTLIAVNVAVFLVDVASAGRSGGNLLNFAGGPLADKGALVAAASENGFRIDAGVGLGEWWRIFTSGFLHAGLLHLGMNMLALWVFGSQLEPALGRLRFLALYVTSLLAGAFAVLLFTPYAVTVGASGAIFGLLGVAFIYQRAQGINPWRSGIGALIVINVLISFTIPGISIAGHIGGLIGGGLTAFLVFELEKRVRSTPLVLGLCATLSVALFVGCLWAASLWRSPLFNLSR